MGSGLFGYGSGVFERQEIGGRIWEAGERYAIKYANILYCPAHPEMNLRAMGKAPDKSG
jgi:hypothetical protein